MLGQSRVPGASGEGRIARLARLRPRRVSYPRGVPGAIMVAALLGGGALVVAEFFTLYTVHLPGHSGVVFSQGTGAHNSWAMVPIAVLAVLLAASGVRGGGRFALTALAVLAVVSLLIGLLGDLPDAHRTGLYRNHSGRLIPNASSTPSAGMYAETFGSIMLIAAAGLGLLFAQSAGQRAAVR